MFRNVRFYQLQSDWPDSEEALSQILESAAFEPCGPLTERSNGWMQVYPDASNMLARRMKAEARDELMPKSLLKSDKIWGCVDLKRKIIGVDAL